MPLDKLLTVREAQHEAEKLAHKMHSWCAVPLEDHHLDADRMFHYHRALYLLNVPFEENGFYHYEPGLELIKAHVLDRLRNDAKLKPSESELRWAEAIMGRVHTRPPQSEIRRQTAAALRLKKVGERGEDIYQAVRKQFTSLRHDNLRFIQRINQENEPDRWNTLFANILNRFDEKNLELLIKNLKAKKGGNPAYADDGTAKRKTMD